jgi:hypothetical protein
MKLDFSFLTLQSAIRYIFQGFCLTFGWALAKIA